MREDSLSMRWRSPYTPWCRCLTLTGVTAHEWLGLAVLIVLFVHGVQHYDFVAAVLRSARSSGSSRNAAAAEVANADGATGARAVGVAEAAGDRGAQSADDRTLRFARPRRAGAWARLALDATLLLALAVVVLSGLMESGAILPALGWYAEGYLFLGSAAMLLRPRCSLRSSSCTWPSMAPPPGA